MSTSIPLIDLGALMQSSVDAAFASLEKTDVYGECKASPNAFENWIGTVEALGLRTPETILVECPKSFTVETLENMPLSDESERMISAVCAAVESMAEKKGFPVFVKNSFTSNKHDWAKSCCFHSANRDEVASKLANMAIHLSFGPDIYASSIVIREMIKTDAQFHAFEGRMPITKEFRFFATNGKAEAYQPYWPKASITQHNPSAEDWETRLDAMKHLSSEELEHLSAQAVAITAQLGGFWSVDFLCDTSGQWWLIDMAEGNLSYVDPDNLQKF